MDAGLASLFAGSLLASTLLPGGVEALLLVMVQQGSHTILSLFLVATIGSTLGGVITFYIGVLLRRGLGDAARARIERWFALDDRALARVRHYGTPVLLLSWMPLIGDPLCLAGGFIGLPPRAAIVMIAIGKAARYAVLLLVLIKI